MAVVTKLSLIQLVFIVLFSLLVGYVWTRGHGVSAFMGGMICVLANLFFAGKLFLSRRYVEPEEMLQGFYRSEVMKLVFTVAMFVLVFALISNIKHLMFIVGYSLTALLNLVCLPFLKD